MDSKSITLFVVLIYYHRLAWSSIVQTNSGLVRGITIRTPLGKDVNAFLGIPYAEPPLGKVRFKPTVPVRPWKEILNATQKGPACMQNSLPATLVGGFGFLSFMSTNHFSEDCLTLSIWVPKIKPHQAAVMVFIYGGGHAIGSTSTEMYDGSILAAEEEVLVVTMNYRVGALGFLFLDHPDVPGNAGLYDQNLALKWIKDNIAEFGGDAESITLFGESSGAACVGVHLMSPLSTGIITRAILQSGSPTAHWNNMDKKQAVKMAMFIVENLGCDQTNVSTMVQCLQTVPAEDIISNIFQRNYFIFNYMPVVDGNIIPDDPKKMMKEGRFSNVSIITGSVKDEGGLFLVLVNPFIFIPVDDLAIASKNVYDLGREEGFDDLTSMFVLYAYTGITKYSTDRLSKNTQKMVNLVSDYGFNCPLVEFESYYAKAKNEVFKYVLPYNAKWRNIPNWMGTVHGEDLMFVFGDPFRKVQHYTADEEILSRRFMRYWANFARSGNPNNSTTPDKKHIYWPRYTAEEKEYLVLAPNSTSVGRGFRQKFCSLWINVIPQLQQLVKKCKM